uniref:FA complementation group E n=1 Tax=Nothoprocta perdicaria TaxID=30464 RepID=A0A8C6YYI5_NOTPE
VAREARGGPGAEGGSRCRLPPSRLLLHALASGSAGTLAALRVLQRGRVGDGPTFSWQVFTDALCSEEPTLEGPDKILAVRPRLLLLPAVCQRNLLCVLRVAAVPRGCRSRLHRALASHPSLEPWVRALAQLLPGAPEPPARPTLLTAAAQQRLGRLRREILGHAEGPRRPRWGWDPVLRRDTAEHGPHGGKRKEAAEESLEREQERPGKRRLREEAALGPPLPMVHEEPSAPPGDGSAPSPAGCTPRHSQQDGDMELSVRAEQAAELQLFIQVPGPLDPLGECQGPAAAAGCPLRVLTRCARQLEGLCSFLQLSSCPERLLVRFCSWLLALAPDLSYASASILAEQLFLTRVLALTQPPSRHLMAALASFCSKYALPFCRILVAPILQEPAGGGAGEAGEGCVAARGAGRGAPLMLLCQEALSAELLELLVLALCRQAPALAASLRYAKLLTALLTLHQSRVSVSAA